MSVLDKWIYGQPSSVRPYRQKPATPRKTIAEVAASSAANRAKKQETIPIKKVEEAVTAPAIDPAIQKKLDRYFERLRAVYPDGVIVRLNTGQKKLAERGSKLRHMLNWEQDLDSFFALGGFTYQRSESGRPSTLKDSDDISQLIGSIQALFPEGVPSVAAIDKANHRIYLTLRSAARKEACSMTEFMKKNKINILKGE